MLFSEEDAPLLKAWIVKRIENTSDADADVLADYVIALLKHDGDLASVRKLCEQEIVDFLNEDTKSFLDDVFQALALKSYLPGGAKPPPQRGFPQAYETNPSSFDPAAAADDADASPSWQDSGSRKRGFGDRGDPDHNGEYGSHAGGRPMKQARRGGRRGKMDGMRGGRHGDFAAMGLPPMPPGMPPFDPMEAMRQLQAMGMQIPAMMGSNNQSQRRGRCRDFDTRGFCSRGSTCPYDHGDESLYVPMQGVQGEEYDPSDPSMQFFDPSNAAQFFQANSDNGRRGRGGGRRGRGIRGGRKGGSRAAFSADGPVHDRSKSTVVVENIPEESFSEEAVRDFFAQFGNVVDVTMQAYKHLAIVKFDKWASANAAYNSPKVIFDNRFVKVFWFKDDGDTTVSPHKQKRMDKNGSRFNGDADPGGIEQQEPEMDMEEFSKKQEEAQKAYKEKEAKRLEVEQQLQELEKKQQDLLAKQREEHEKLQARFASKNRSDNPDAEPSSVAQGLRAKLAALEQEAKFLGLDPNAADDASSTYSYRGGGGGPRGRGGPRSRGSLARSRGSFRGQVGRHAAYAQYSLDNRPKKLAITGVDLTHPERDESLRHFLLNMGEFESVDSTPTVTNVSFQDRKTAEKFFHSLNGKELPGVDGRLELTWVSGSNPGSNSPSNRASSSGGTAASKSYQAPNAGHGGLEEGVTLDAMQEVPEEEEEEDDVQVHTRRQVDMDYEVEDGDGW